MGLDKFHQCLTTLFPNTRSEGNSVESFDDDSKQANDRTSSRIPVKFTKNAVELLRETLTAFLRKVGRELVEELEEGDPLSQQPIRPEDIARVLAAFDDNIAEDNENGGHTKKPASTLSSKNLNRLPQMKEIVNQAQDLLLERNRLEGQESKPSAKRKKTTVGNDNLSGSSAKIKKKRGTVDSVGGDGKDLLAKDATTAAAQPPKKKRGKQKKPKIKITAEMEAEQERLLNASKKALESSQQQKGNGGKNHASFRVELS